MKLLSSQKIQLLEVAESYGFRKKDFEFVEKETTMGSEMIDVFFLPNKKYTFGIWDAIGSSASVRYYPGNLQMDEYENYKNKRVDFDLIKREFISWMYNLRRETPFDDLLNQIQNGEERSFINDDQYSSDEYFSGVEKEEIKLRMELL